MWVIPVAYDAALLGGCRTASSSNGHHEYDTETATEGCIRRRFCWQRSSASAYP
jgi:hypothetical protein